MYLESGSLLLVVLPNIPRFSIFQVVHKKNQLFPFWWFSDVVNGVASGKWWTDRFTFTRNPGDEIFFLFSIEKGRFFRLWLPALNLLGGSKQSLPQEDPDAVMIDLPKRSDESITVRDLKSPTKESCSPSEVDDTRALIGSSRCLTPVNVSGPLDHSSPKWQWDRLYPDPPQAITFLAQGTLRDSLYSMRRASSVQDIEGFGSSTKNAFRDRHPSEGIHL